MRFYKQKRQPTSPRPRLWHIAAFCILLTLVKPPLPLYAAGVTFQEIADAAHGITYQRVPSTLDAMAENLRQQGAQHPVDLATLILQYPLKPSGAPGVALLDYDGDGDLDIYATNGPGGDNALYANQTADHGTATFVEVPGAAGAAAREQDSTGACYGDIDNDGDPDLLVLGRGESVRLYQNNGGSFTDITFTAGSQIGGHSFHSSSCAMGDVNGDGLLDVFIGNTFDWVTKAAIVIEPWALNEHNQLFLNSGGGKFTDVSTTSGIRNVSRDISWSAAMFDYDMDGDIDILVANDQGAVPFQRYGGVDRGFVKVLRNDGTGHFAYDRNSGLRAPGGYMGFAIADYNGDGHIDLYVSNIGDWVEPFLGLAYSLGDQTTRWFLSNGDGTFRDPGVGSLRASGWAWGTSALDYDNDGDFDIASVGGLDVGPFVDRSNPGTILTNDGAAGFSYDANAFASSMAQNQRRNGHGLATGDLNGDGFEDVVSVSDANGAPFFPVVNYPFGYGTAFDHQATFVPSWIPTDSLATHFVWSGVPLMPGTLSIQLNSGGNGNGFVNVRTVGTQGIVNGGRSNRDGIGATVRFTPQGGRMATQPVLGGSSHSSQDSLIAHFGLGTAPKGTLEVVWQGGVKNRLYDVANGESVRFPEIPCDFSASWPSSGAYRSCVGRALNQAVAHGVIPAAQRARFLRSALRAYNAAR